MLADRGVCGREAFPAPPSICGSRLVWGGANSVTLYLPGGVSRWKRPSSPVVAVAALISFCSSASSGQNLTTTVANGFPSLTTLPVTGTGGGADGPLQPTAAISCA